jgi:Mn-dependent DtxR family transcriptional regulator
MDKYDFLLLDVILSHKQQFGTAMRLNDIERGFWKRIESDESLNIGQARIGERLTNLYVDDLVQNKNGYSLTRKGREVLSFAPLEQWSVAS